MYRIEREEHAVEGRPGEWRWRALYARATLEGVSHEPLLDACRALKRAGADGRAWASVYRPGRKDSDIRCHVGVGAELTTTDTKAGRMGFRKYESYNPREKGCG